MRTLSNRASFRVSAMVVGLALWASAAPSMSYPLYAASWGLTPALTTTVFAVYPVALVVVLLLFGNLSDYIGRRASMLLGLGSLLIGALCFAAASDVWWLFVGRAFMGIGVGLSLSPGSAAMIEFSDPAKRRLTSAINTAATALGVVIALFVGGALVQYAPLPLHLDYLVLALVLVVVGALAWFLPHHTEAEARGRWRPQGIAVPKGLRLVLITAAAAITCAYTVGALLLSLGGQIAHDLVGSDNAFVTGALMSTFGVAVGIVAIVFSRLAPRLNIGIGAVLSLVGVGLLVEAGLTHNLWIFLASSLVNGAGYSLTFLGGVSLIGANAPAHHRAGMFSAAYLIGYVGQGLTAVVLGLVATRSGIGTALDQGAIALGVLFLVALFLAWATRLRRAAASTGSVRTADPA
ncbi:MFS transporter [Plantibacter sp. Mn2098]|uniref:MFS transporter n=1 Tax=Plantibacter sp. Mn2098 TaxID=3395266 RepID=UPI003BD7ABBA